MKTEVMQKGIEHHEEAERIERETAILVPLTLKKLKDKKQDLNFVREDVRALFEQEFEFPQGKATLTLFGRADKLMRKQSALIVADDKRTGNPAQYDSKVEPYPSQLLQVLTYLHSKFYLGRKYGGWVEIPHTRKMYQLNIVDGRTRSIYKTFEDVVTKTHTEMLNEYTSNFTSKCIKLMELEHHHNKGKCRPCGYFKDCSFALR